MKGRIRNLLNKGSEHFYFVGATIISAGIHFLYSIFVKAHIDPLEYGMYSTCLLLKTYLSYIQLGSLNAFNRDYPQIVGAGDLDKAKKYRDTTFTYLSSIFITAAVVASLVIIIIGNTNGLDKRYILGLILSTIITATTILENFLSSRVRIDGSFKYTSIVIVVELLSVGVGFVLIPWIGYYGLYCVTIGSMVIGIVMYYRKGISDINFSIDKTLLKSIIISGMPLLINGLIWTIVESIDKFVILGFMNAERLGMYSIAQMAFSYMILVPSAMSQLFYVNLGKAYGASGSKEELNRVAVKYTLVIAVVIGFFVQIAYFFIRPAVEWVMPKYADGVKSAQFLMLGLAIYAPTMVNGNILTILKKNAALLRGSLYLCFLNIACSIGLILILGVKIENVAIGTAISYLVRTVILIIQLKREAESDVWAMINASVVPVLIIAGPGIIFYHIIDSIITGFIVSIVVSMVVVFALYWKKIKNLIMRN